MVAEIVVVAVGPASRNLSRRMGPLGVLAASSFVVLSAGRLIHAFSGRARIWSCDPKMFQRYSTMKSRRRSQGRAPQLLRACFLIRHEV